jgi:hypothetical protein
MMREPHFSVLRGGVLYFYEGRLDITTPAIAQILARKHKDAHVETQFPVNRCTEVRDYQHQCDAINSGEKMRRVAGEKCDT